MPGTRAGGPKIVEAIKLRLGEEGYRQFVIERGRKGGKAKVPKGFAKMPAGKLREVSIRAGMAGSKAREGQSK